jgi:Fe-S cluster assembly protein SufD
MTLAAAIRTGDVTLLPGKREEDWRWTDLRGLLRALPGPSDEEAAPIPPGPFGALGDVEIAVVNGRTRDGGAESLTVGAGKRCVARLRFVSTSSESRHESRLAINVHTGGELVLLESHEGPAHGYVTAAALDLRLDDGAKVERIVMAGDGEGAVNAACASVVLAPDARFAQTVLTDGARRQRLETRVDHPGGHAELRLDGIYLLKGQRHADLTTVVDHAGTDGATDQLAKGVVADQSRGVFQGRIVVAEGADRTDARMGHHALILSDRAEVDAKPELEIYADDVSCAHGNTVGALDEDALFYARQRGVGEPEARALLTAAFVGEVVDRIGYEPAREAARAWVAERLGL